MSNRPTRTPRPNNMAKLMSDRGFTEEKLSQLVGIRLNQINPIKNGKQLPRVDRALLIARALKASVEDIWGSGGSKNRAA